MADIAALIEQDHAQLDELALVLGQAKPRSERWQEALTEAHLTHVAHTEAEHVAFTDLVACSSVTPRLHGLIKGVTASHRAQDRLLEQLQHASHPADLQRTSEMLRAAMVAHSNHQRIAMWPELRRSLPEATSTRLGRTYAAQRRLALAMLKRPAPAPRVNSSQRALDEFDLDRALTVLAHRSTRGVVRAGVQRDFVVFTRALVARRRP